MPKVGIVGSGFIGGVHYGSHSKLADSQVVAICDIDVEKAKKTVRGEASGGNLTVGKSKPIGFDPEKIEYYSDYDRMLKNKDIEIIDICLPTHMHKEAVIKAAKAGFLYFWASSPNTWAVSGIWVAVWGVSTTRTIPTLGSIMAPSIASS